MICRESLVFRDVEPFAAPENHWDLRQPTPRTAPFGSKGAVMGILKSKPGYERGGCPSGCSAALCAAQSRYTAKISARRSQN